MIDNAAALSSGTLAATPTNVGSLLEDYVTYERYHINEPAAEDVAARGAWVIRRRQDVFSRISRGGDPAHKATLVPLRAELKLLAERWEAYSKHGEGALGANALPPLPEEAAIAFFEWADARLDALRSSEIELRKLADARCAQIGS